MRHVYNFAAGPSVLPEPVLQEAADEMLNYKGSGMSVMETAIAPLCFSPSLTRPNTICVPL